MLRDELEKVISQCIDRDCNMKISCKECLANRTTEALALMRKLVDFRHREHKAYCRAIDEHGNPVYVMSEDIKIQVCDCGAKEVNETVDNLLLELEA